MPGVRVGACLRTWRRPAELEQARRARRATADREDAAEPVLGEPLLVPDGDLEAPGVGDEVGRGRGEPLRRLGARRGVGEVAGAGGRDGELDGAIDGVVVLGGHVEVHPERCRGRRGS